MEPNMDVFMRNMERQNEEMNESLKETEAENQNLHEKIFLLKKALEKEKKFHRTFADEVTETEKIRNADFKREKREYIEGIKSLRQENKRLAKDVEFYKKAHEELANTVQPTIAESIATNCPEQISLNPEQQTSSTSASMSNYSLSSKYQKSSKEVVKINLALYEENKKFQLKIKDISSTVSDLKKKNKQLEISRNKIENKKKKFGQDSEELKSLVDSSRNTNRDTYTPEMLSMLGKLAKNKK